jgi:hypothetical protein
MVVMALKIAGSRAARQLCVTYQFNPNGLKSILDLINVLEVSFIASSRLGKETALRCARGRDERGATEGA